MIAIESLECVARRESSKGVQNPAEAVTPYASMLTVCRPWQFLVECLRSLCAAPVTSRPLAWFRIGLASVLLVQALSLIGHLHDLFGHHGMVAWSTAAERIPPGMPTLTWMEATLVSVGVSAASVVPLVFSGYVVGLLGLVLGCQTRPAACVAWLGHTALLTSANMATYGVDSFAQIGLFYCVCFPVGQARSLDHVWRAGSVSDRSNQPSFAAWLGLRILQLHVCIIYTASGLAKASGEQWWNGEAIWRAVMGAPLGSPIDCAFLASIPWLVQFMCWMTLLLEAGVIAFVWHPRLRRLWLVGVVGMHLGIAVLMNLWTFSATMIVFDVAAFGVAPQHRGQREQ
jgi:hypothetical protein